MLIGKECVQCSHHGRKISRVVWDIFKIYDKSNRVKLSGVFWDSFSLVHMQLFSSACTKMYKSNLISILYILFIEVRSLIKNTNHKPITVCVFICNQLRRSINVIESTSWLNSRGYHLVFYWRIFNIKILFQPWAAAFGPWEPIEKKSPAQPMVLFSNEKRPMGWAGLGWAGLSPAHPEPWSGSLIHKLKMSISSSSIYLFQCAQSLPH